MPIYQARHRHRQLPQLHDEPHRPQHEQYRFCVVWEYEYWVWIIHINPSFLGGGSAEGGGSKTHQQDTKEILKSYRERAICIVSSKFFLMTGDLSIVYSQAIRIQLQLFIVYILESTLRSGRQCTVGIIICAVGPENHNLSTISFK